MAAATGGTGPLPRGLQELAAELRRIRDLAGVSGRELAQRIGISQAKVSRIESGSAIPSLPEVTAWGEALEVAAETRERLTLLTETAYTEVHPYRAALQRRGQGQLQDDVHEQETLARQMLEFQPSVVPGLLQTAAYARRIFGLGRLAHTDDDLAAAVAARLHRQLALYDDNKRFDFLITEAALRWRPGPTKLLLAQLSRIDSLTTLDNVSIGLIPYRSEAVTFMSHSFVVYEGDSDDNDDYVTVETIHARMEVRAPVDIDMYRDRWASLGQMAVFDEEARRFLAEIAADIRANAE